MKQADILFAERSTDFVEGPLLVDVQFVEGHQGLCNGFEPPHFLLIDLEHAFVHQPVEHGRCGTRAFQQFGFGHLLDSSPSQTAGEFDILHQQVQLLGGPSLQFVEEEVQPPFVARRFGEAHTRLGLGLVGALQFFLHKEGVFFKQRLHHGEDVLQAAVLLQPGHRLLGLGSQQVKHFLFAFGQRFRGFEVRIVLHHRFALQLQPRGQGRLIDIALRAEVIVGQPLPKPELQGQQDRLPVEHGRHLLHFVILRLQVMHIAHNARIELLLAERHHHPAAYLYLPVHFRRQGIRETGMQGQGQYDVDKLLHRCGKDTTYLKIVQKKRRPSEAGSAILVSAEIILFRKCRLRKSARFWSYHFLLFHP